MVSGGSGWVGVGLPACLAAGLVLVTQQGSILMTRAPGGGVGWGGQASLALVQYRLLQKDGHGRETCPVVGIRDPGKVERGKNNFFEIQG